MASVVSPDISHNGLIFPNPICLFEIFMKHSLLSLMCVFSLQVNATLVPDIPHKDSNPFYPILEEIILEGNTQNIDVNTLSWYYLSADSPKQGDSALLADIIFTIDSILTAPQGDDVNIVIFDTARVLDAIDQILLTEHDALSEELLSRWWPYLEQNMLTIYEKRRNPEHKPNEHGLNYPNPDAFALLAVSIAKRYFELEEPDLFEAELLQGLSDHLYADGAWSYLFESNEEPAYHGVVLTGLARYYERTGSVAALSLLVRSAPYYPLSVEVGGVTEGSTSPYWKHRWDVIFPWFPGLIAGTTHDAANQALYQSILEHNHSYDVDYGEVAEKSDPHSQMLRMAASNYKNDIEVTTLPDDYLVWDRNIEGPRARHGDWSYTFTGRDLEKNRGKYTFFGTMVTDTSNGLYPLSGAVQIVMPSVYYNSQDSYILGMNDVNRIKIEEGVSYMTTVYDLQEPVSGGGDSRAVPWRGIQLWIADSERAAGLVCIEPKAPQIAFGLEATIRIGAGRGLPFKGLTYNELEDHQDMSYSRGKQDVRIVSHNFEDVIIRDAPDDYRGESDDIVLRDSVRVQGTEHHYTDERYCMTLEIKPADSEYIQVRSEVSKTELSLNMGKYQLRL